MESPNTQQGENPIFEDPYRLYNGEFLASSPVSLYGCIPLTHTHPAEWCGYSEMEELDSTGRFIHLRTRLTIDQGRRSEY